MSTPRRCGVLTPSGMVRLAVSWAVLAAVVAACGNSSAGAGASDVSGERGSFSIRAVIKTTDRALATGTLASSAGASGAPGAAQLARYQDLDCGAASPSASASTEPTGFVVSCGGFDGQAFKYLLGPSILDGGSVASAQAVEEGSNLWAVRVQFDDSGTRRWASWTTAHRGTAVAMLVDGRVVAVEYIQEAIPSGKSLIEGGFTQDSAKALAQRLDNLKHA